METPWKYIFYESSGGDEYDKMLTWSEELNIFGYEDFVRKITDSSKWDRIHTDFMASWWDHSVPFAKGLIYVSDFQ